MIPILYKEHETNFNHNGIAMLHDTVSYTVTEERNGAFELELEYPVSGQWVSELLDFRLISAKPNDEDESHLFRIYELVKNLESQTITVYASSKTNDLGGNMMQYVFVEGVTAQEALLSIKADLLEPTSYNFISDIETLSFGEWENQNPLNCISGTSGSIISRWGGEIKRTDDTIFVYGRRGTDNVALIRQGKNLEGFTQTISTKGIVTSIMPFVTYTPRDTEIPITIRGDVVDSPLVHNYPVRYIKPVDYSSASDIFPEVEMEGEMLIAYILDSINIKATTYFSLQNPGCDEPKVTIDVDLMQLSDSSEYEQFKKLEHISLTDTVTIWVEKFNVDVEITVHKLVYDGMSEQVINITAGSAKYTMYDDVNKTYLDDVDKLKEYVDTVENGIYNTIRLTADQKSTVFSGYTMPDASLVKTDDLWYKPVANGEVEMYRWNGSAWALAVTNADKIVIGSIDASRVNLINLNADNISTGTIVGSQGAWNLNTGEFYIGSSLETANIHWNGETLILRLNTGETVEEALNSTKAWTIQIFSTNGAVFKNDNINTTLMALVYKGTEDITDTVDANRFRWTRVSKDLAEDILWNNAHFGGTKSIDVTPLDVNNRATFNVSIT